MGQAKNRGTYAERVAQAQAKQPKSDAQAEQIIHDTDSMVMLDVHIANVFSTKLGVTKIDESIFPMKNTEANIQLAMQDHKRHGLGGTDQQILLAGWGVITGQCMAAANDKGMEFFTSKPFMAYLTENVKYILDRIKGDVKTVKLRLAGSPNTTGLGGDPYLCGWSSDSKIELLDKAGKVIESVNYATIRQGKTNAELFKANVNQMAELHKRTKVEA